MTDVDLRELVREIDDFERVGSTASTRLKMKSSYASFVLLKKH